MVRRCLCLQHLDEWSCGVGAGAAAALMAERGWSTTELLANVIVLQSLLRSEPIAQPMEWGGSGPPQPHKPPARQTAFRCGFSRCFSAAGSAAYNNSSCAGACSPLGAHEWLANSGYWQRQLAGNASVIKARVDTVLKKSELSGGVLPASERMEVKKGFVCALSGDLQPAGGYFLCTVNAE